MADPLRRLAAAENPFEDALGSERPWSSRDVGTNAISGFLNDLAAQDRAASFLLGPKGLRGMDSLPVVPPTPLRKIRIAEFEPYLRSLADVIDKHQLNRALGLAALEGIPQLGSSTDSLDLSDVGLPEFDDLTARITASASASASYGPSAGPPPPGSKSISKMQRTRMLSANAPSLASIPSVFLQKDFDLANPNVFSAILEHQPDLAATTATPTPAMLANNRALQDKLTLHLDTVEVHLLKEISRRSSAFFSALSNLQSLHNETELCVAKIQSLRKSLATVSQKTAKNGLEVIRLKRRRGNLGILYGTVKLLIDIKQTQPMIHVLLGHADYVGALDLIEDTSLALRGMETPATPSSITTADSNHVATDKNSAVSPSDKAPSQTKDPDALHTETLIDGVTLTRSHSIIPRNMDLRGVRSLVHLSGQLSELSRTVSAVMESELANTLLADLRESVTFTLAEAATLAPDLLSPGPDQDNSQKTQPNTMMMQLAKLQHPSLFSKTLIYAHIKNIASGAFATTMGASTAPATQAVSPELIANEVNLRAKLTPVVLGLMRMDKLGSALHAYRDALLKEVKTLTKKHYPVVVVPPVSPTASQTLTQEDPATEAARKKKDAQTALAKQLRSMTVGAFYSLLSRVYITSLVVLQRVAIVHELLSSIITDAQKGGIVIGSNSVNKMAVESTVQPHPHVSEMSARRKLLDDDDEFGSFADLVDVTTDPLQRSRPRGETFASGASSGMTALPRPTGTTGMTSSTIGSTSNIDASGTGPDSAFGIGPSTFTQMTTESSDVLFAAADLSHARCAKLVGVRSEQNAQLNPTDFYRLFGASWEFVTVSESLCGRMCFGLKGGLLAQAKAYIAHFHDEKCKQIAVLLENEQWVQAEVPVDFQRITEQLHAVTSGVATSLVDRRGSVVVGLVAPGAVSQGRRSVTGEGAPSEAQGDDRRGDEDEDDDDDDSGEMDLTSTAVLRMAAAEMAQSRAANNATEGASVVESKTLKFLIVGGNKYYVVGSVLLFLKALTEYIICAENLSALATDVLNRILELLKLFNSRTCQVILGAGAMQSAGLKNITARHIALAAQSLGMVIALLPSLKDGFSRLLPPKQGVLLGDFDRIVRDYREHQSELYSKLVSIMGERLALHSSKLVGIHWDNPDPREISAEESVTVHMGVLVKETATLHRVLSKYLPGNALRTIMGDIFRGYVKRLEEDLRRVELYSSAGKNRLLMDVQYFTRQLSALDGVDGPGSQLEVCVNNIKIRDKRAVATAGSSVGGSGMGGRMGGGGNNSISPVGVGPTGSLPTGGAGGRGGSGSGPGSGATGSAGADAGRGASQFASSFGRMLRSQNDGQH